MLNAVWVKEEISRKIRKFLKVHGFRRTARVRLDTGPSSGLSAFIKNKRGVSFFF